MDREDNVTQGGTRGCLWAGGEGSLRPNPMRGDGRADPPEVLGKGAPLLRENMK